MQWNEAFRRKVMSAEEAVQVIRSGDHVWVHAGCNSPVELTHAITGLSRVTVRAGRKEIGHPDSTSGVRRPGAGQPAFESGGSHI